MGGGPGLRHEKKLRGKGTYVRFGKRTVRTTPEGTAEEESWGGKGAMIISRPKKKKKAGWFDKILGKRDAAKGEAREEPGKGGGASAFIREIEDSAKERRDFGPEK